MMRRLGLLLALAVIVTMIMIVSAMPAMAEKPAFPAPVGRTSPGTRGGGRTRDPPGSRNHRLQQSGGRAMQPLHTGG
jgi:hypothetical protein